MIAVRQVKKAGADGARCAAATAATKTFAILSKISVTIDIASALFSGRLSAINKDRMLHVLSGEPVACLRGSQQLPGAAGCFVQDEYGRARPVVHFGEVASELVGDEVGALVRHRQGVEHGKQRFAALGFGDREGYFAPRVAIAHVRVVELRRIWCLTVEAFCFGAITRISPP